MAQKALTLVKNDQLAFPISPRAGEKALILFADSCASRVGYGELVKQMLADQGALQEDASIEVMVHTAENVEECIAAAKQADHIVLVHRVYNAACLNPETDDGFSTKIFDDILEDSHATGKKVILVSCQLPYDAGRFQETDAILLTYGSSVMRSVPPVSGAGSAYVPNLAAALCACFGQGEVNGKLPVMIPNVNDQYEITDVNLYERAAW